MLGTSEVEVSVIAAEEGLVEDAVESPALLRLVDRAGDPTPSPRAGQKP